MDGFLHVEHVGDLSGVGDYPCPVFADELVRPGTGHAGHRADGFVLVVTVFLATRNDPDGPDDDDAD